MPEHSETMSRGRNKYGHRSVREQGLRGVNRSPVRKNVGNHVMEHEWGYPKFSRRVTNRESYKRFLRDTNYKGVSSTTGNVEFSNTV